MKKILLERILKEPVSSAAGAICFLASFLFLAFGKLDIDNFFELLAVSFVLLGIKDKHLGIRRRSMIIALAVSLLAASCVTQKKCQKRFPTVESVKDSTYKEVIIEKRDSIIHVPGEVIRDTIRLECDTITHKVKAFIKKKSGSAADYVALQSENLLLLEFECHAKDLRIQSLEKQVKELRIKEKTKVVPVIEFKTPIWDYVIIIFLALLCIYLAYLNLK
jgi:hypothetical protein